MYYLIQRLNLLYCTLVNLSDFDGDFTDNSVIGLEFLPLLPPIADSMAGTSWTKNIPLDSAPTSFVIFTFYVITIYLISVSNCVLTTIAAVTIITQVNISHGWLHSYKLKLSISVPGNKSVTSISFSNNLLFKNVNCPSGSTDFLIINKILPYAFHLHWLIAPFPPLRANLISDNTFRVQNRYQSGKSYFCATWCGKYIWILD